MSESESEHVRNKLSVFVDDQVLGSDSIVVIDNRLVVLEGIARQTAHLHEEQLAILTRRSH